MRWAAPLMGALLLGCGSTTAPTTEAPPTAPTLWPSEPGWHVVATLPGFRRPPKAIAGDRTSARIAVLGGRGRRVAILADGAAPDVIKLPADVDGTDVGWRDGAVVVVDAGRRTLTVLPSAGGAQGVVTEPIPDDRVHLASRPDGSFLRVDQLGRAYKEFEPAWRGVPGPGLTLVRATNNEAGPMLLIAEPEGKRRRALLAGVPKARDPRVIGMEPGDPLVGWMAVWTGEKSAPELHFVRFDGVGRVLHTERAPSAPSPFDLRASIVGANRPVLATPTDGGLEVRLLVVPAPTSSP